MRLLRCFLSSLAPVRKGASLRWASQVTTAAAGVAAVAAAATGVIRAQISAAGAAYGRPSSCPFSFAKIFSSAAQRVPQPRACRSRSYEQF